MQLCDINPYLRWAELQPWVLSNIPLRRAYDYRIFYILEGRANFILEDRKVPLTPGTLLYFRPGVPYSFDGMVKGIVLNFDMTRNQADYKEPRSPIKSLKYFDSSLIFENDPPEELSSFLVVPNAFEAEEQIRECLLQYTNPTPYSDGISSALLKQILCYLAKSADRTQGEVPQIVRDVLSYLQQNYDKDLSNDDISQRFGYHSYYLNRTFKQYTGMTLHQAFLAEKLKIAKRLLRETELSVVAVAEAAGFSDRSQFCTAFRKHTGRTPSEYRRG